jgi:hypothetical protein
LQAQRGADPETRFRDAVQKQQAQGDLNGAIQIYQEIAASPNASRALKARALLQLATSMETQGQQAETVYERIVKEFPDQPEASNARKKLESLKPPTPLSLTQITFGSGVQNVVATDGQRAIYWGAERTTLFIGDNGGKTRKQIFTTTPQRLPRVEASRDLSLIFLYFVATEAQGTSYAVIRTDGLGAYRELALQDKGLLGPGTLPLYSVSWSFDNRYVVLCKMGQDRVVRPFKLSIDDGEIVALAPGHPTSIGYAVLSPDGLSLAFQEVTGNAGRGVFIEPVQGGEPQALAPNWVCSRLDIGRPLPGIRRE